MLCFSTQRRPGEYRSLPFASHRLLRALRWICSMSTIRHECRRYMWFCMAYRLLCVVYWMFRRVLPLSNERRSCIGFCIA